MIDLLPFDALAAVLWQVAVLLAVLLPGLLFFGTLADQAIFEGRGRVRAQAFGPVDLLIAGALAGLFVLMIARGWHDANDAAAVEVALPSAGTMIGQIIINTFVVLAIMIGIITALSAREINWRETFGLDRFQPVALVALVGRAIILLVLALPLIYAALAISQVLLAGGGSDDQSDQELVRFLKSSGSGWANGAVAVSAILLAPVQEEFIFRGYIYGVVRRYAGVPVGILVNAALFAGVHLHAPSFGGLFVLAVCLTLAYEWTGSLLVPMAVHALFNSLSIVQLLSGGAHG